MELPYGRARSAVGRWWLDLPLRTKGLAVTVVPLVITVSVLLTAVVLQNRESGPRARIEEATQTLVTTSALVESALGAESGVRGYAATGDESLLLPYDASAEALPAQLETLHAEAPSGYTTETQSIAAAGDEALVALGEVAEGVADPQAAGDANGLLAPGSAAVDEFEARINPLRVEMLNVIDREVIVLEDIQRRATWTLSLGLVVVILSIALGGWVISSSIVGRTVRLSDNVKAYWAGRPLKPTLMAGDEVGHLSRALGKATVMLEKRHDQLRTSRDAALAATQAKDEFLSRMSHELRTPLTAIIGFGQLLQMEDRNESDRESIDHIVGAGHHLLALINEVLDIAKIETGHLPLSVDTVAVADVVADAVAMVRTDADERSITISVAPMDGIVVEADAKRLTQVVLNLLSNAVKYNDDGGNVEVNCTEGGTPEDGRVRLAVIDDGPGIAPEHQDRLFEPFERLTAPSRGIDGTGVGLTLSKGLVEAMGGTLGVASVPGAGSTFWVELALAGAGAGAADRREEGPVEPPPETRAHDGAPLALYIEDNTANVRLMERVFRDRPERLEVAVDGRAGIDVARELQPQVVLLDLHLPDVDGREVLAVLKADPTTAEIPVVVISADALPRTRDQLRIDGAVEYLTKPIDVPELLGLLDRIAASARFSPRAVERDHDLRHA